MCAVSNMAVFWSSLTSYFPCMLLTYFLNDFEIVQVALIITGITFVFTFHMRRISIVRSLYFRNFSASFLITLQSPEIATSINIHVPFSLARIIMSFVVGDNSVSLYLVITQYGYLACLTCFYWFWHMFIPMFLSSFTPFSLHMLKCSCARAYHVFLYIIIIIIIILSAKCEIIFWFKITNFTKELFLKMETITTTTWTKSTTTTTTTNHHYYYYYYLCNNNYYYYYSHHHHHYYYYYYCRHHHIICYYFFLP